MPFTLDEVRDFTANLNHRIEKCENGEGLECANLDAALSHYAGVCCQYLTAVKEWARAIFAGKQEFNAAVERLWLEQGRSLYARGLEMAQYGEQAEVPCYDLPGQNCLKAALWDMDRLLRLWVSPQRSASPSARIGLPCPDPAEAEEISRRIASLPELPVNWKPADRRQQSVFRKLKREES